MKSAVQAGQWTTLRCDQTWLAGNGRHIACAWFFSWESPIEEAWIIGQINDRWGIVQQGMFDFPEAIIAGAFAIVVRFGSSLSEGVVAKVGRIIQSKKCLAEKNQTDLNAG